MIVLSSVIVVGYQYGQRKYALNNAANKLASDIRKTQTMARSGVEIEGKYCSVGIHLDRGANRYLIFGNTNCDNHKYSAGEDEILETVDFGSQISIEDFEGISGSNLSIAFEPPRPDTYINSSDTPKESDSVVIILADDDYTRQIMVTGTGAIGVKK